MPTKRGPLVKKLRQFIAEMPPENFAPWKEPNNKMKKIINTQIRGKLEGAISDVQHSLAFQHLTKLIRARTPQE
jgi:hypothetical protein